MLRRRPPRGDARGRELRLRGDPQLAHARARLHFLRRRDDPPHVRRRRARRDGVPLLELPPLLPVPDHPVPVLDPVPLLLHAPLRQGHPPGAFGVLARVFFYFDCVVVFVRPFIPFRRFAPFIVFWPLDATLKTPWGHYPLDTSGSLAYTD